MKYLLKYVLKNLFNSRLRKTWNRILSCNQHTSRELAEICNVEGIFLQLAEKKPNVLKNVEMKNGGK